MMKRCELYKALYSDISTSETNPALFFEIASKSNPRMAAAGVIILTAPSKIFTKYRIKLATTTNNEAKATECKFGISWS